MNQPIFDPRSPEYKADPNRVYDRLLQHAPVFQNPDGTWIAVTYGACSRLLGDPKRVVKDPDFALAPYPPGPFRDYNKNSMVFMDAPDHPRVRATVAPALAPIALKKLETSIQSVCDELLEAIVDRDSFDFVESFAGPFPLYVICEMLGVPRDHRAIFRSGAHDIVTGLEPGASADVIAAANRACAELGRILTGYVADRRGGPGNDIMSFLMAQEAESKLSHAEFINQLIFLLVAGHETTATLLSTGLKMLLDRPDVIATLRADPTLYNTAVSEILRLHPPLQFVPRQVAAPIEIDDVTIPVGSTLLILIGAANRDASMFPNPEVLDLRRTNAARHLAFSSGPHTCLGNNLARMEARIAFRSILARMPDLEIAGVPRPNVNALFQGYDSLPARQKRHIAA